MTPSFGNVCLLLTALCTTTWWWCKYGDVRQYPRVYVHSSFLPCDAMRSTDYAIMRCLSIRLSRSWILSKRVNINRRIFSLSRSHTILVFQYQTLLSIPTGPLTWALNTGGVWRNGCYCPVSRFIAFCQRCYSLGVINMVPLDRGELWHLRS